MFNQKLWLCPAQFTSSVSLHGPGKLSFPCSSMAPNQPTALQIHADEVLQPDSDAEEIPFFMKSSCSKGIIFTFLRIKHKSVTSWWLNQPI